MSVWGIGYQGSKNKIAQRIIDTLPSATHLYDIFCGGGSISHCALMSGKWEYVHFSDHDDVATLLRDFLQGNIPDGSEWVSREDFYARKDTEPWIRVLWSWSGNCRDYIYSRALEPYKKAVHEMIYAPTPNERRLKFKEVFRLMQQARTDRPNDLAHLERLQRVDNKGITPPDWTISSQQSATRDLCEGAAYGEARLTPPPWIGTQPIGVTGTLRESHGMLESDSRLNRCREALQAAPFLRGEYDCRVCDYREVDILPDSIVYCDIPYIGVREYKFDTFDHPAFYDWCEQQEQPVFISEYWMPEDRFFDVAQWERVSTFSATNNGLRKIEKLFMPLKFRDWWDDQNKKPTQLELF